MLTSVNIWYCRYSPSQESGGYVYHTGLTVAEIVWQRLWLQIRVVVPLFVSKDDSHVRFLYARAPMGAASLPTNNP
jgi:hypothetical protein